ncbi:hypothetical protein Agub_g1249, partial [Astrephomene gubernaculifera]
EEGIAAEVLARLSLVEKSLAEAGYSLRSLAPAPPLLLPPPPLSPPQRPRQSGPHWRQQHLEQEEQEAGIGAVRAGAAVIRRGHVVVDDDAFDFDSEDDLISNKVLEEWLNVPAEGLGYEEGMPQHQRLHYTFTTGTATALSSPTTSSVEGGGEEEEGEPGADDDEEEEEGEVRREAHQPWCTRYHPAGRGLHAGGDDSSSEGDSSSGRGPSGYLEEQEQEEEDEPRSTLEGFRGRFGAGVLRVMHMLLRGKAMLEATVRHRPMQQQQQPHQPQPLVMDLENAGQAAMAMLLLYECSARTRQELMFQPATNTPLPTSQPTPPTHGEPPGPLRLEVRPGWLPRHQVQGSLGPGGAEGGTAAREGTQLYDHRKIKSVTVTGSSKCAPQLKVVRRSLLSEQLGACWVKGQGVMGVLRALQLVAQVRQEMLAQGRDLVAGVAYLPAELLDSLEEEQCAEQRRAQRERGRAPAGSKSRPESRSSSCSSLTVSSGPRYRHYKRVRDAARDVMECAERLKVDVDVQLVWQQRQQQRRQRASHNRQHRHWWQRPHLSTSSSGSPTQQGEQEEQWGEAGKPLDASGGGGVDEGDDDDDDDEEEEEDARLA